MLLWLGGKGVPSHSPCVVPLLLQGWGGLLFVVCYCLAGMKVLALYMAFSDTYPLDGVEGASLQPGEGRSLGLC